MHNVTTKIMSEDKIDDKWCHYSGMPSPSFYMNDDKWNMIPSSLFLKIVLLDLISLYNILP